MNYDQATDKFSINYDQDNLQHAIKRSYYRKIQNLPLTPRQSLPWEQPGSPEYGKYLCENAASIASNYKLKDLVPYPYVDNVSSQLEKMVLD